MQVANRWTAERFEWVARLVVIDQGSILLNAFLHIGPGDVALIERIVATRVKLRRDVGRLSEERDFCKPIVGN